LGSAAATGLTHASIMAAVRKSDRVFMIALQNVIQQDIYCINKSIFDFVSESKRFFAECLYKLFLSKSTG
jgi:hypothetical protein